MSPVNPVSGSHEFPVYRMQHFDLHGIAHGSRSAAVNLEARSLTGWSTSRHCVISKLQDLTIDHFRNIRIKAGALLVVLPNDLSRLNSEEKQHLLLLEHAMLAQEISIPVYFATWTAELDTILDEVSQNVISNDLSKSAAEAMISSIAANGYQFVVSPGTTSIKQDIKVATIQGHLSGYSQEGKVPTIAIVAHYDSFGVAPNLSFGADSNGSGVVILLELARLFSNLYSDPKTRGKYNLVFLLTGGGKINYQGSKKWLEDQLDALDGSIIQYFQDSSFVMCLDTLSFGDSLYMHVSKPPKDNSPASLFFKELKTAADQFPAITVDGVHKKINLADDILAWEHERYSIRRLPAFTLSTLKSHRELIRGTILDTRQNLNLDKLTQNTKLIAEALASFIYNTSHGEIFGGSLDVDKKFTEAWINYLTSQPRSPQLLSNKDNALVMFLKDNFNKYLRDVKVSYAIPDKRDPDFLFYDVTKGIVNVYSVKPAIFDLVLTLAIILYLGIVYFLIQKFPFLYSTA
ncbi:nicalin-1, partial [Asbolus verrucosus]